MKAAMENEPNLLLHAYLDGELDPAHALEFERELASNRALAAERERVEALQKVIRELLPPVTLPPGFARRIEAAIGETRARPLLGRFFTRRFSQALASPGPSWRALAASVMLAAVLASGSTWFTLRPELLRPTPDDVTTDMVLASHLRALKAPQPIDVPSSDRHTVKPWFNGRVSEAPRVVDLSSEGFPLVGGRVDVIGRVPVPTLVYRRRQHLISLFAIPEEQAPAPAQRSIAGYNILTWTQDGILYWAVSDVALPDLEAFAKAFREAAA
jgi:anti-sigma factor RsiW